MAAAAISELKRRILDAAKSRVRGGFIVVGGERFAVDFRVYPAKELNALTEKIRKSTNRVGAGILAEQILDPADHRPIFKAAEIEDLANCDMVAMLNAFLRVNLGDAEKN